MDKRQEFLIIVQTGILAMETHPYYKRGAGYAMDVMSAAFDIKNENIRDDSVAIVSDARDYVYYQYLWDKTNRPPIKPHFMEDISDER